MARVAEWTAVARPARGVVSARVRRVLFSRPLVVFGLVVVGMFLASALFAPLLAPYDPYAQDLRNVLQRPSAEHWLGTDALGRDVLSRLIYGARTSLIVAVGAVLMGGAAGVILGLIAGFVGGRIGVFIMRCMDALMAMPPLVFTLVITSLLGAGVRNVMVALAVAFIPGYTRLTFGQTLSVKENEYVLAARALGASTSRIMFRHILPNCLSPLIVQASLSLGGAMLIEGSLSFLGVGIKPPTPAWGSMVLEGYRFLTSFPILSLAPGLALMIVVFAFNMVGDGIRDALDPRLRGVV
ncbi:MAG: ABC transporter permease [Armatimonadetes bacterium]|nr:ABC transporter permease [Armatimonadota bacterium]MDW8154683.1 ABC transporter permease [Armatimonadota bacterium]